jgi:hypothetical protein
VWSLERAGHVGLTRGDKKYIKKNFEIHESWWLFGRVV